MSLSSCLCLEIPYQDCQMSYGIHTYMGNTSVTTSGEECLRWEDVYNDENVHGLDISLFWEESWDELGNKCR